MLVTNTMPTCHQTMPRLNSENADSTVFVVTMKPSSYRTYSSGAVVNSLPLQYLAFWKSRGVEHGFIGHDHVDVLWAVLLMTSRIALDVPSATWTVSSSPSR